jgi:hypothetical protein
MFNDAVFLFGESMSSNLLLTWEEDNMHLFYTWDIWSKDEARHHIGAEEGAQDTQRLTPSQRHHFSVGTPQKFWGWGGKGGRYQKISIRRLSETGQLFCLTSSPG